MEETLENMLNDLYCSEINAQIKWCWDGGFDVAMGNVFCCGMNAEPEAKSNFQTIEEVKTWLTETAIKLYPKSMFALERQP